MGIVRFALRFPYTFYALAALILFLGISAIRVMPVDIFPEINIPVVNVIWQYTGLSTPEMEQRVSTYSQYAISTSVSGIKNMEAQTLNGISVQKIFFQPDVNIDLAIAQIVSATNYIRVLLPTGIQAPIVVSYNASSIPVLQLSLASENLNEQKLYDYGYYNLRQQLAPVPGVTFPTPDGGKYRQIMVDIDPTKLQAKGLTPTDVVNAVNAENLTLPSGLAKIGDKQYTVLTNQMPTTIEALNNIPIKFVNGATVLPPRSIHAGSPVTNGFSAVCVSSTVVHKSPRRCPGAAAPADGATKHKTTTARSSARARRDTANLLGCSLPRPFQIARRPGEVLSQIRHPYLARARRHR